MRTTVRHIITWAILGTAAVLAALSCEKDPSPQPADMQASESMELHVGETDMAETKSSIAPSETAVRNTCFAIYDASGNLARTCYFTAGGGSVSGLVKGRRYHVYALANMGDRSSAISGYSSESAMRSGLTYGISTYSSLSSGGIPMASDGSVEFTCGSVSSLTVPVERLAAKYNVRVDRSLLSEGDVTVKSVALRQAAYEVLPFEPNLSYRWTDSVGNGDTASSSDLSSLNSGGSVAFYMLENRQGTLLPGNTDPWAKVPGNITARKDQCTYLEMECSYDSETLSSDNVTYRMYLGENSTTNFDISRNTVYTLTFRPTDEGMGADSWKIDPGDVTEITYGYELVVSPSSAAVKVGSTKAFTATYVTHTYTNGVLTATDRVDCTSSATWTSSKTSVATVSRGTATGVASGTATISASFSGKTGSATLSVSDNVTTSNELKIAPASATVNVGSSVNLTATYYTYTYTNGTLTNTATQNVTSSAAWSSSSTARATVSAGKVSGVSAGSATITATYSGKSATASVTVRDVVTYVYELKLSPVSAMVNVGSTTSFSAVYYTYTYTNGVKTNTSSSVVTAAASWSSSSSAIATVSGGTARGVSAGTATITATYNGYNATATVTVKDVITYAYELKITPASATIYVGGSRAFTATYYTYTYTNGNLTNTSSSNVTSSASWSSSSTAVATVSSGTATGRSAGTTTIKATWSGKNATASLTVQDYVETRYRIKLTPAETTVNEGGTVTYTVTRYSDTWTNGVLTSTGTSGTTIANSNCSWSVTAGSDCASVSSSGVATGTSMGTATIKAALKSDSTVYATAVLNVDYTINVNPGSGGTGSGGNKF